MPEETLSESVLPAAADPGEGKPEGEKDASQTQVSRADVDRLEKTVLDLAKKLDQGLKANRQSATDTIKAQVASAQKSQSDFLLERLAAYLPKDGPSLDALKREAYLDEQMAKASSITEDPASPQDASPPPSGASLIETEIAAILEETGLTGQEPELREYVAANKGKRWYDAGPGFADLARKIAARKRGSPGGVMPGKGLKPSSSSLETAYLNEIAQARKDRRLGLDILRGIRSKYREAGLENVEAIDISSVR